MMMRAMAPTSTPAVTSWAIRMHQRQRGLRRDGGIVAPAPCGVSAKEIASASTRRTRAGTPMLPMRRQQHHHRAHPREHQQIGQDDAGQRGKMDGASAQMPLQ